MFNSNNTNGTPLYAINIMKRYMATWEGYFAHNREVADKAEEHILTDKQFTYEEYERARKEDLKLRSYNILFSVANKLINEIAGRKPEIVIEEKFTEDLIKEMMEKNKQEINNLIRNLILRGYSISLIYNTQEKVGLLGNKKQYGTEFKSLTEHLFKPFMDYSGLDITKNKGRFCGYSLFLNRDDYIKRYDVNSDFIFPLPESAQVRIREIVHFFHQEGDHVTLYVFPKDFYFFCHIEVLETDLLPMVLTLGPHYIRNQQLFIKPLGLLNEEHQKSYNALMTTLIDKIKQYDYKLVTATTALPDEEEEGYTRGSIITKYTPTSSIEPKQSEPTLYPPVMPSKEIFALIKEIKDDIMTMWNTEADISLTSKYDSFDVISEKQRQAQSGSTNFKLAYEASLHLLIEIILSYFFIPHENKTKYQKEYESLHYTKPKILIGEDELREKATEMELYRNMIQYTSGVSPILAMGTVIQMLQRFNTPQTTELAKFLAQEQEALTQNTQKERDQPTKDEIGLQREKMKAEMELQMTHMSGQYNLEVAKENTKKSVISERLKLDAKLLELQAEHHKENMRKEAKR